ncbi:hypothetical protein [Bilifractor porci]|uniref:Uncharacterized protein n=1 Tax=Bilifractor porci TaxID=2606636 RepID=A0A7X2P7B3_9FIRM|nr:hypothetical protein [Bilifractor porci]MST81570.1 hypothetical protein [Bilifractor porci]
MNKQQRNYAMAKSHLQLCEDREHEQEAAYIRDNGITNEDGTTPERIWMIEDETVFDLACAGYDGSRYDLTEDTAEARKQLRAAENDLIDFGLDLLRRTHPKQADTLEAHRNDYNIREKLIDLSFKLDTRTIK